MITRITLICLLSLTIGNVTLAQDAAEDYAYYCVPCDSECDDIAFTEPGDCPHCGMRLLRQTAEENKQLRTPIHVAFYLQDGVEVLDFAGPMEVFSYAGMEVFTVSKTKDPITSQGILTIVPDYTIEDAPKADILAFFGGNSSNAFSDEAVINWVKNQEPDYHFSVCTGAFALAAAGVLDGLTATTFHNAIEPLRTEYPQVTVLDNARFVDNGRVITTAGISAGIDGALYLVQKLYGRDVADAVVEYMEYDNYVPDQGVIVE